MKKFFLLCLVAAASAATFASCSKKDDDGGVSVTKDNLVGTWEIYKAVYKGYGETEEDNEWGSNYGYIDIYEFRSDGTGVETWKNRYYDGTWHTDESYFTYTLSGNTLRIKYDDGYDNCTVEKLTSNQLVITWKDDGESETYYLKRI